jgi:hypothetical protein
MYLYFNSVLPPRAPPKKSSWQLETRSHTNRGANKGITHAQNVVQNHQHATTTTIATTTPTLPYTQTHERIVTRKCHAHRHRHCRRRRDLRGRKAKGVVPLKCQPRQHLPLANENEDGKVKNWNGIINVVVATTTIPRVFPRQWIWVNFKIQW